MELSLALVCSRLPSVVCAHVRVYALCVMLGMLAYGTRTGMRDLFRLFIVALPFPPGARLIVHTGYMYAPHTRISAVCAFSVWLRIRGDRGRSKVHVPC